MNIEIYLVGADEDAALDSEPIFDLERALADSASGGGRLYTVTARIDESTLELADAAPSASGAADTAGAPSGGGPGTRVFVIEMATMIYVSASVPGDTWAAARHAAVAGHALPRVLVDAVPAPGMPADASVRVDHKSWEITNDDEQPD